MLMNWRATNHSDGNTITGDSYPEVCNHIKDNNFHGSWVIEYFDSNQLWIEMDKIILEPETGELFFARGSHTEHI